MFRLALLYGTGAVALALYTAAVDRYGDWKMKRMASIPPLEAPKPDGNDDPSPLLRSSAELLRTVSSRSGLVEKLDDRRAWNAWLLSPSQSLDPLTPGRYTFQYRSYVNIEESGAIKKALFHMPSRLGFVARRRGTLTVQPNGKTVTLKDFFLKSLITPVTITWNGKLRQHRGKPTIVWTSTEMSIGSGKAKETMSNPPISEQLRQIPWQIIKNSEGIVGFRRGDIGLLAYAATCTDGYYPTE